MFWFEFSFPTWDAVERLSGMDLALSSSLGFLNWLPAWEVVVDVDAAAAAAPPRKFGIPWPPPSGCSSQLELLSDKLRFRSDDMTCLTLPAAFGRRSTWTWPRELVELVRSFHQPVTFLSDDRRRIFVLVVKKVFFFSFFSLLMKRFLKRKS